MNNNRKNNMFYDVITNVVVRGIIIICFVILPGIKGWTDTYYTMNCEVNNVDGEVIRQELTQNCKVKGVKPISHGTKSGPQKWGEDIKSEFGVNVPGNYTPGVIARVNNAINRVIRSRGLLK